jgi:hypothetical protein
VHLDGSHVLVKYKQVYDQMMTALTLQTEDEAPSYGLSVVRNTNYANWEPLEVNEGRGNYLRFGTENRIRRIQVWAWS